MYIKLAIRNVKKSYRDFAIYFLTLLFGVCVFYVFNSVGSQRAMLDITKSQDQMLKNLTEMLGMVSVFVSVILGFLILYANQFLLKRRKKEFGMYQLLGMEKGKISKILISETLIVGIVSLAAGLLLGTFLSQGLAVVTAKLFDTRLSSFRFVFSPGACGKTVLYFGIVFLLAMVFNSVTVSRAKLIDLFLADKKNELRRLPGPVFCFALFLLSVVCIAAAYIFVHKTGLLNMNLLFGAAVVLGIAGTLLFFASVSGLLVYLVQSCKKLYLKGLNMFVLRQLSSKIGSAFVSITVVCLMLFVAVCTLSGGIGIADSMKNGMAESTPYDMTAAVYDLEGLEDGMLDTLRKKGQDISLLEKSHEAKIYQTDVNMRLSKLVPGMDEEMTMPLSMMRLSDYNALLRLQGKSEVTLTENEALLNCTMEAVRPRVADWEKKHPTIGVYSKTVAIKEITDTVFETSTGKHDSGTLIVPDDITANAPVDSLLLAVNGLGEHQQRAYELVNSIAKGKGTVSTREHVQNNSNSLRVTMSYLAIYLGIVFLITSAAVLAIGQLSQASDNTHRYRLLEKLGAKRSVLGNALLLQTAAYFLLPLLLAAVHCIVGMEITFATTRVIGGIDIASASMFAALILAIIYGGYFIATYFASRNIIFGRSR
jgi:putative ABC transport system permease protein